MRISRNNNRRRLLGAAAMLVAAGAVTAGLVTQSFAAPSNGLKHPPRPVLKDYEIDTVAQGFDQPTTVTWAPDGTMFVGEREGRVWEVTPDGTKRKILDITDQVATARERGLGTVQVADDYEKSRKLYLSYTYLSQPKNPEGAQGMRLSYIRINPDGSVADPSSPETVVLGKDGGAGR